MVVVRCSTSRTVKVNEMECKHKAPSRMEYHYLSFKPGESYRFIIIHPLVAKKIPKEWEDDMTVIDQYCEVPCSTYPQQQHRCQHHNIIIFWHPPIPLGGDPRGRATDVV